MNVGRGDPHLRYHTSMKRGVKCFANCGISGGGKIVWVEELSAPFPIKIRARSWLRRQPEEMLPQWARPTTEQRCLEHITTTVDTNNAGIQPDYLNTGSEHFRKVRWDGSLPDYRPFPRRDPSNTTVTLLEGEEQSDHSQQLTECIDRVTSTCKRLLARAAKGHAPRRAPKAPTQPKKVFDLEAHAAAADRCFEAWLSSESGPFEQ